MDKVKRIIFFSIPMSICNFRCHYCYLGQRDVAYQGKQVEYKYTPEEVGRAFSPERIGGLAYFNFCADGETLLTKNIDEYIKAVVEQGHYAEIITNLTIDSVLEKILQWDKELLKRIEFKCSFHYLELKQKNLLDKFAANVKKVWEAGASATIEVTPSDELIPYIEEMNAFSMEHFGSYPHLTIARNDRTEKIEYLTKLSEGEYEKAWAPFGSAFWEFKRTIFGIKQNGFCYAGRWSLYVDLTTGKASQCYCGDKYMDVIGNPEKPLPENPIGKCEIAHCYNGHAFLTWGLIPELETPGYGDIRDKENKNTGKNWLQPELKAFFNTKLKDNNELISEDEYKKLKPHIAYRQVISKTKKVVRKMIKG